MIGQNVPFVTGQFTNTGASNGSVNPFQTIERKDVGLTLRVKPQISENGTVRMQIFQEVSSIQPASLVSATGLITNKRSIESNVLVDDGAIVVLGGLLQDEYAGNEEKVPLLGDIPVVGNLFRTETRSRKKTNLMVFLRPVVVRDAVQSDVLSLDRYDLMRGMQGTAQPAQQPGGPDQRLADVPAASAAARRGPRPHPGRPAARPAPPVRRARRTPAQPAPATRRPARSVIVRYPLPYAFARGNQLLLEDDGQQITLWHAAAPAPAALTEVHAQVRACAACSNSTPPRWPSASAPPMPRASPARPRW